MGFELTNPGVHLVTPGDPARTVWFLNQRITFQLMRHESASGTCIMLAQATQDDGPPWHVHHSEDEVFHVLKGRVRFRVGNDTVVAWAGQTVLAPCGIPHGFRIMSPLVEMLIITRGGFETVVRNCSRPAQHDWVPDHADPTPEALATLAAECAAQDIDILGPPID